MEQHLGWSSDPDLRQHHRTRRRVGDRGGRSESGCLRRRLHGAQQLQYQRDVSLPGSSIGSGSGGTVASAASSGTFDSVGNQLTSSTTSGGATSTTVSTYTATNQLQYQTVPGSNLTITGASWSSGGCSAPNTRHETLDFASTPTPPGGNSWFVLSGVTPSNFNGTFESTGSFSSTSTTYCLPSNPGTWSSGGTLTSETLDSYDYNGNLFTSMDGEGNETCYTYWPSDLQDVVTSSCAGTPTTETTTYDADGNELTDTTGSDTTTNTYNDADWKTSSQDANGNTTTYVFDNDGNVITETDPGVSMAVTGGSWASTSGGQATLTFAPTPLQRSGPNRGFGGDSVGVQRNV